MYFWLFSWGSILGGWEHQRGVNPNPQQIKHWLSTLDYKCRFKITNFIQFTPSRFNILMFSQMVSMCCPEVLPWRDEEPTATIKPQNNGHNTDSDLDGGRIESLVRSNHHWKLPWRQLCHAWARINSLVKHTFHFVHGPLTKLWRVIKQNIEIISVYNNADITRVTALNGQNARTFR